MTINELAVLEAWKIGPVLSAMVPANGTINRTLLIETAGGSYALRAYRHRDRLPVEREHAVIAHVCAQGVPAVGPIPLPGGETILVRGGRFYALFPRAPGAQLDRAWLTRGQFAAMGAFLARVQDALRSFPPARAGQRIFAIDRAATLANIDQLEAAIRARPARDEIDGWVLTRLAGRRAWIERSPYDQLPDLSPLGRQVIHGDYQETNLFFEGDRVVAIIDWDQGYVAPRAWEVVRTLHLTCKFEAAPCRAFLEGYRAQAPLDPAALDLAAACYALLRAHDLWLYQAIYFEGNDRKRRFVSPGQFVPLIERWVALNETLKIEERRT